MSLNQEKSKEVGVFMELSREILGFGHHSSAEPRISRESSVKAPTSLACAWFFFTLSNCIRPLLTTADIHARVQPLLEEKYVPRPEGIQKLVDSPTLNSNKNETGPVFSSEPALFKCGF